MKGSIAYRSLLLLTSILASHPSPTQATPFPTDFFSHILHPRQCENPCGFYSQVCCSSTEECYTDQGGLPACRAISASSGGSGGSGDQWEYFTTTYTQTGLVTVTSTGSRMIAAPTSDSNTQCRTNLGESVCSGTCCSAAQACSNGVCVESGGSPIETPGPAPTAPSRPTSTIGVTMTATATVPFIPAVGTNGPVPPIIGGGGGLSGGAIAGAVIGSLAGAFILVLLCLCCCVGSIFDRLRALLGLGGSRKGSSYTGSSRSSHHGGWFGVGGRRHSRSSSSRSSKKQGGLFGLSAGTIGILAALAMCLGLRKKKSRHSEKSNSRYGSSYSYSYYGSSSSSSSSSHPN